MQAALGVNTLTVLANIKTLLGQTCTKMIKLVSVVVGECATGGNKVSG